MAISKTFIALLIIFIFSVGIQAHDHNDPNLHEADFSIELDDCNTIHVEPHVLASELNALFFFWTDEPGFDSHSGTFSTDSLVGFNILDPLKKWDGEGFDVLDPNTDETLTVSFLFGSEFATCNTGTGFVEGFEIPVAEDGSWHKHLGYTLNGVDNNPRDGIYLLKMELYHTSSEPEITYSNPFWIVLNLGIPEEDHHNAIHWVEENMAHLSDLEQDGVIDFKDFAILASQWLNANCDCLNNFCNRADITEDGIVDLFDLSKFASNWLKSADDSKI